MSVTEKALSVLRYAGATKPLDYIQNHLLERDVLLWGQDVDQLSNVDLLDPHAGSGWAVISSVVLPKMPILPAILLNTIQQSQDWARQEQKELQHSTLNTIERENKDTLKMIDLSEWLQYRNDLPSFFHTDDFFIFWGEFDDVVQQIINKTSSQYKLKNAWNEYTKQLLAWRNLYLNFEKGQKLYRHAFDLYNQLKMDGGADLYEIVWGMGMVRWEHMGSKIYHPLVVQPCELVMDEKTQQITISVALASAELQWAQLGLPQHGLFQDSFSELSASEDIFPFEFSEPKNRTKNNNSKTHEEKNHKEKTIETENSYWGLGLMKNVDSLAFLKPDLSADENRLSEHTHQSWPAHPEVEDAWVIYLRKRPQNRLIDDINAWNRIIQEGQKLPEPIVQLLEAQGSTGDFKKITYRGLLGQRTFGTDNSDEDQQETKDLFFATPYNDEQLHIIDKLERNSACVVQGPPGTGKTHTIANIISHYLAQGKRVLVTASSTNALEVVRGKLPTSIRDLSATLLSSDATSLRDFEESVDHILQKLSLINEGDLQERIFLNLNEISTSHQKLLELNQQIIDLLEQQENPVAVMGKTRTILEALEFEADYLKKNGLEKNDAVYREKSNNAFAGVDFNGETTFEDVAETCNGILNTLSTLSNEERLWYQAYGAKASSTQFGSLPTVETQQELGMVYRKKKDIEYICRSDDKFLTTKDRTKSLLQHIRAIENQIRSFEDIPSQIEESMEFVLSSHKENVKSFLNKINLYKRGFDGLKGRVEFNDKKLSPRMIDDIRQLTQNSFLGKWKISEETKNFIQTVLLDDRKPKSAEDWKTVLKRLQQVKEVETIVHIWNGMCDGAPAIRVNMGYYEDTMEEIVRQTETMGIVCDKHLLREKQRQYINEMLGEGFFYHQLTEAHLQRWHEAMQRQEELDFLENQIQAKTQFWGRWHGHPLFEEGLDAWRGAQSEEWGAFLQKRQRLNELESTFTQADEFFERLYFLNNTETDFKQLWINQGTGLECLRTLPHFWEQETLKGVFSSVPVTTDYATLQEKRKKLLATMAELYERAASEKAWLHVFQHTTHATKLALASYLNAVRKIGKNQKGVRSARFRSIAKESMQEAYMAIPCWIMPEGRVFESMPAEMGVFDLVIVDEASQSTITMFPALLRGKKLLIVGDDKQVSPSVAGLSEQQIQDEHHRYLKEVPLGKMMTRDHSLYDIFSVAFASTSVMLREHFRSPYDIISYANHKFYHEKIIPLVGQQQHAIEPLKSVYVEGVRDNDVNILEAQTIVKMIADGISSQKFEHKTIGVVTLPSDPKQSILIRRLLDKELQHMDVRTQLAHKITIGPPAVFQGSERDIMFISMVWHNDRRGTGSREFEQRVNVAMTRAKQQMILVHSLLLEDSKPDGILRSVLTHFAKTSGSKPSEYMSSSPLYLNHIKNDFETKGFDLAQHLPHLGLDAVLIPQNSNQHQWLGLSTWGFHSKKQDVADRFENILNLERAGWNVVVVFAVDYLRNGILAPQLERVVNTQQYIDIEEKPNKPEKKNMLDEGSLVRKKLFKEALAHPKTLMEMKKMCDSPFEEEVMMALYPKYHILMQADDYGYRMDMIVFDGMGRHVVIECDGDAFHQDSAKDDTRQRFLERRGWNFVRIWGSEYYRNKTKTLKKIVDAIAHVGVTGK